VATFAIGVENCQHFAVGSTPHHTNADDLHDKPVNTENKIIRTTKIETAKTSLHHHP
jgi:hypothetical protein